MIGLVSAGEIITLLRMLCLQGRICFAVCLPSLTTDASMCTNVLATYSVNYGALRAVFALVCLREFVLALCACSHPRLRAVFLRVMTRLTIALHLSSMELCWFALSGDLRFLFALTIFCCLRHQ